MNRTGGEYAEAPIAAVLEDPMRTERDFLEEDIDDDDEVECRVCRGPTEEGRPLFTPCKCSGSMGMVHQDCLTSWLEVTKGDGRCEICKIKFRFDPQYAENAPDCLPIHEVLLGLSSQFVAKWLPLAVRVCVALFLWLVVAPLLTNFLYHGWMIRPSSILTRWKRELILTDIVSGVILSAIIIISFLSLMSFADFMRVNWQQGANGREGRQRRNEGRDEAVDDIDDAVDVNDEVVDKRVLRIIEMRQRESREPTQPDETLRDLFKREEIVPEEHNGNKPQENQETAPATEDAERGLGDINHGINDETGNQAEGDAGPLPEADDQVRLDILEDDRAERDWDNNVAAVGPEDNNPPAFDAMDPMLQEDQVDMEINVALDELLGLRGPIGALVRNLLWLLAFNATYLGIFGFVPKTIGSVLYSGVFNTTFCSRMIQAIPFVYSENQNQTTVSSILSAVEQESIDKNTTFRLSDLATVTLGYFSIATMIVMSRYSLVVFQKMWQKLGRNSVRRTTNNEVIRLHQLNTAQEVHLIDDQDVDGDPIGASLFVALDTTVAIVKVGVLLFMKMFLLPLFLGFCLDASTIQFFGHDMAQRFAFAGSDLFSFILLHWVSGITFMLLVTVFLLQLREVTHPDILAGVIRPQEPQPDLLGNLLHESVVTHMKRMVLSLIIYAPLLSLHVYLPIRLFMATGLDQKLHFFRLNLFHFLMPQLQIPLELITFHLSMLALLERHKNSIGGLQHRWMKFMCKLLGLTEYLLPREICGFEFVGAKKLFCETEQSDILKVDNFFLRLARNSKSADDAFILSEINTGARGDGEHLGFFVGESKPNGERVLFANTSHIALPSDEESSNSILQYVLLPTKFGKYRLTLRGDCSIENEAIVEFFREVPGVEIPRPPEGWDDLGAGGAWAQGRWAWSKEQKSIIEVGVAERTLFRSSPNDRWPLEGLLRITALLVLSWCAITLTAIGMLGAPLALGRSFYYLLRIPRKYVHDPFAFCVGAGLFYPMFSTALRSRRQLNEGFMNSARKWLAKFSVPPRRKMFVVFEALLHWFLVAPMLFGVSYEVALVRPPRWFAREESLVDWNFLTYSWLVGTVVLNTWAFLLYSNFFTKQFWVALGNGILEPPMVENGDAIALAQNRNPAARNPVGIPNQGAWQGNNGRVAEFFKILQSLLNDWAWDAVNVKSLLDDFARPVSRQLASALIGSSLSYHMAIFLGDVSLLHHQNEIQVPIVGKMETGLLRMIVFRVCMCSHILIQLASSFRESLDGWFEAAHRAARDDRYLIGEVLLNYDLRERGSA